MVSCGYKCDSNADFLKINQYRGLIPCTIKESFRQAVMWVLPSTQAVKNINKNSIRHPAETAEQKRSII